MSNMLNLLNYLDDFFWGYVGAPMILGLGLYFSFKSGWIQIFKFHYIMQTFFGYMTQSKKGRGIHPLHAFFASIGGCIGIGNVVGVATAVQIGGPGAILWMWLTALLGMIVKYSEIYLGIKYRIQNKQGTYDGGPMIFLQQVFKSKWIPRLSALLLCVYGVEIYMFRIITHSIHSSWNINNNLIIALLLISILLISKGGIERAGQISTAIMPFFVVAFSGMGLWVLIINASQIPAMFVTIFKSAFTGHAAIGAFAGSSVLLTISQGVRRACYTGDIAVGYASVIHSETQEADPAKQASLGILGIFLDTFVICSFSVLLILITGTWNAGYHEDAVVAIALAKYFSYVDIIWPIFIFLLGYSSLIAFFAVGMKAATFLSPKYGYKIYFIYAIFAFLFFSFIGKEHHSLMIMSLTGMFLALINLFGIYRLRKNIKFTLK